MDSKKSRFLTGLGVGALASGTFFALGWSLFDAAVCVRPDTKPSAERRLRLPQMEVNHPRHQFKREYEAGKAWWARQPLTDRWLESADGLMLHAYALPAEHPERTVILCHGYRGSGFGDFAGIGQFLHENGCNLLLIDERGCGKSEGKYITFGAKERFDIQRWAYDAAECEAGDLPIYLYGESMGATAVLMAAGLPLPRSVRGMIADCGFSSMRRQLQEMAAEWLHLHWSGLAILRLDLFCRALAGFRVGEVDTVSALSRNHRPVLFFHGEQDTYVRAEHSRRNFAHCCIPKELIVVPGARHLCCAYAAPELYRKELMTFFHKNDYGVLPCSPLA